MNPKLVTLTQNLANQLNIAPYTTTFSPAGHDIQNISRPGIPTVMIHCPSRNNGISHTPEEYSNPQDLEWGTRLSAAVVYTISQNID